MVVFYHSITEYLRILSTDVPAYGQILLRQSIHLRTIIVIADIDEGFGHSAVQILLHTTDIVNLLASVRRHPLYILLRVSRELCFW